MNVKTLFISSAIAGLAMALVTIIPIIQLGNCLFGMWVWGAAMFGVWLYVRMEGEGIQLTSGQGSIVGGLSGMIGWIIFLIFWLIFTTILETSATLIPKDVFSEAGRLEDTLMGLELATAASAQPLIFCFPLLAPFGGWLGVQLFGKPKARGQKES